MARTTLLDQRWAQLMALCRNETQYCADGTHPKLLRLIKRQIDELASEMGFSERSIATRDFRAERDGDRITRLITG